MTVSKTSLRFIVVVCLVCLLFSPTISVAELFHLTILHTSTHHGHFAKFSWQRTPDVGGMAARSTLVNSVRAEVEQAGGHVLLLSAGNVNKGTPAEIAFIGAGHIYLDANIEPGPLTYRDILTILPWRLTLVLVDMTGDQVMEVLRRAAMRKIGDGGFLHVSGLTWTRKKSTPENVLVGDIPIEFDRIYKVVTTSFLADGGDFFEHISNDLPQFDTGFVNASALREYIQKAGTVAPKVEGRVRIIE